jgi:hypothetical protein
MLLFAALAISVRVPGGELQRAELENNRYDLISDRGAANLGPGLLLNFWR